MKPESIKLLEKAKKMNLVFAFFVFFDWLRILMLGNNASMVMYILVVVCGSNVTYSNMILAKEDDRDYKMAVIEKVIFGLFLVLAAADFLVVKQG